MGGKTLVHTSLPQIIELLSLLLLLSSIVAALSATNMPLICPVVVFKGRQRVRALHQPL